MYVKYLKYYIIEIGLFIQKLKFSKIFQLFLFLDPENTEETSIESPLVRGNIKDSLFNCL